MMLLTKYFLRATLPIIFLSGILVLQAHYTYAVKCSDGGYYNNHAVDVKKCPDDPVYGPSPTWLGIPDGDKTGACPKACLRDQLKVGDCLSTHKKCASCVYYDDEGNSSVIKGEICVDEKYVVSSKPDYECDYYGPLDREGPKGCICSSNELGSCTPVNLSCPSCKDNGADCSESSECCSKNCSMGSCSGGGPTPPPPSSCNTNGLGCSKDSDCCSGLFCYNGTCKGCGVDSCRAHGFSNASNASCLVPDLLNFDTQSLVGSFAVPASVCNGKACYCHTEYPTCSFRNLTCPTSANVGSNFNVSYEYFHTGLSYPTETRAGVTNIVFGAYATSASADVLWCESSGTDGEGYWSSESRTVKCLATPGDLKITAGCRADVKDWSSCPAGSKYVGTLSFDESQECTVKCVAATTCTPDTSQACCTGATNLWNNTATNPNKASATGVWLAASQFPESAPPNNQAQCCRDDAAEVYISPTNVRACDGTSACCNANDYVMNGQCYTTFSLPTPANVRSTSQTTTSITWAWNAVSGATYYLLHLNNNTPVNAGNVTTRLQSGLNPNTSYWLEVAACNLCGCSSYSSRITATTLNNNQPPGQPTLEPVQ